MNYKNIDQKALMLAKEYRNLEAELLEIIIQVDRLKVYRKFGYNSLYQYVVKRLELSESQAYPFINVARKSQQVPQLQEAVQNGKLTVSKAKRITSVITTKNQDHWIGLAETGTQKKIEREVAKANPKKAIVEKMIYISSAEEVAEKVQIKQECPRVKLEVGLSEKTMIELRRVQDLVSQKNKSFADIEITIEALVSDYLKRHDPVEKAKRQKLRGKLKSKISRDLRKEDFDQSAQEAQRSPCKDRSKPDKKPLELKAHRGTQRKALGAVLKHQVYLKFNGQCANFDDHGQRCKSRRFLEIHHIKPLSHGGKDEIENLTLLCSGHHKVAHQVLDPPKTMSF